MHKYLRIFLSCPIYSNKSNNFKNIVRHLQPIFYKKNKPYHISIETEQIDPNFCQENFRDYFENISKLPFTYENHMDWRLKQLNKTHCMIILSDKCTFDNSVFEISHNINNRNIPMLVGNLGKPDKTNYIYNLKNMSNIVYTNLDNYSKFENDLNTFISDVGRINNIVKL